MILMEDMQDTMASGVVTVSIRTRIVTCAKYIAVAGFSVEE